MRRPGLILFRTATRTAIGKLGGSGDYFQLGIIAGAGNGIRTRDPNLGKVVLYQLSYSRVAVSTYQSTV